jgi:hypothetical protein
MACGSHFPVARNDANRLTTICSWYIWHGATLRVPVKILQRDKYAGGWNNTHIESKCCALLYNRLLSLQGRGTTVTAAFMDTFRVQEAMVNPPDIYRIPFKLRQLRRFVLDMAYVEPKRPSETTRHFKKRLYDTLSALSSNQGTNRDSRIERKYPGTIWKRVWTNLHASPLGENTKSIWYSAIHDIVPTRSRLVEINITDAPDCQTCGKDDTLLHRIIDCQQGNLIWNTTREIIGYMLRTDPRNIPSIWTVRPDFKLWPAQIMQLCYGFWHG